MKNINRNVQHRSNTVVKSDIANFCMADHRIKVQRQKVRIIASHLMATFRIDPNNTQLVFVLANSTKKNNYDALSFWVNQRLESIDTEDYHAWNNSLEVYLSEVVF